MERTSYFSKKSTVALAIASIIVVSGCVKNTVPTVSRLETESLTPLISGTVGNTDGGFTVQVNGVTYEPGVDSPLILNGNSWSLQIPESDELMLGSYDVEVSAINRAGANITDENTDDLVIYDITAPDITETTPGDLEVDADRSALISATFNEDIFARTVDSSSFTLTTGSLVDSLVDGLVNFDALTNTVFFAPQNTLNMASTYTATVNASITDLSGNVMTEDNSFSFTTQDGEWQTEAALTNGIRPKVAMNSNGDIATAFLRDDGSGNRLWVNYYSAATDRWLGETQLSSELAGVAQVVIDESGNATVAWGYFDTARNSYDKGLVSRFNVSAGVWSIAQELSPVSVDPNYYEGNPRLVVDSNQETVLILRSGGSIAVSRYDETTGAWSDKAYLSSTSNYEYVPSIAAGNNGELMAAWMKYDPVADETTILARNYNPETGVWSATSVISGTSNLNVTPSVTYTSDGNAVASWYKIEISKYIVYASYYTAATATWGPEERLQRGDLESSMSSEAVHSANGDVNVVWRQYSEDDSQYSIWSNHKNAGADYWSGPIEITNSVSLSSRPWVDEYSINNYLSASADNAGNATAVWQHSEGGQEYVFMSRYLVRNNTWSAAEAVVSSGLDTINPQVYLRGDGEGVSVWLETDGLASTIFINSFK